MYETTLRGRCPGYALIAVLWVLVGASALGLGMSLTARETIAGTRNRADLMRAAWSAEDCLERVRAMIHGVLTSGSGSHRAAIDWAALDLLDIARVSPRTGTCTVSLAPAGAVLDVNTASTEQLADLFRAAGMQAAWADSLADALVDWRDHDDVERPYGAERSWYMDMGRIPPRNGPIADIREIRLVRGYEEAIDLKAVLGVEPGRVSLRHAPPAVLLALPGMEEEAVARVMAARRRPGGVPNLSEIANEISPSAGAVLLEHYAELVRLTTPDPDAWIVTSRGHAGSPPVTAAVQVRLLRADARAAVVRRKTWIE